jgi:hypothetical protein
MNFNRYKIIPSTSGNTCAVKRMKRNFQRDGVAGVVLNDYWFVPEYASARFTGTPEQCAQWIEANGGQLAAD